MGGQAWGGINVYYGAIASAELYTPQILIPARRLFSVTGGMHDDVR
jgi:hypothetical protein